MEAGGNSGLYSLLSPTAVSALPVSLTNSLPASAPYGWRLLIRVWAHTATGTITVAGTAPFTAAVVSETTTTLPLAEKPGDYIDYVTTNVYATVNASGVTLGGGLTNGQVVIYGMQACFTGRMTPGEMKLMMKFGEHSPTEQRGVFEEDFHLLRLKAEPEWEYASDLYDDRNLFLFFGFYNSAANLTVASIPASPTSLLVATAAATSGSASLTTQPTAPGYILIVTIAGGPATAATVTVTGVNEYGESYSEVIVPSTKSNGTWYSEGRFSSVNASGVAWGAFGGVATVAVSGVFGYSYTGSADQTGPGLSTFCIEQWDSEASLAAPYAVVDEVTLEFGMDKEFKVSGKGPCQYVFPVGDLTSSANQITAFAQPQDVPDTGWRAIAFIDPIGNAFGTTLSADVIDGKITVKVNQAPRWTSAWNPPWLAWSRMYRKRAKITVDMTLDFTSTVADKEFNQGFMRRQQRRVQIQVRGALLGTSGGTTYYKGFTANLPLRWTQDAERDFTTGQESVILKLKGNAYYDIPLGYSHKFTWYSTFAQW